MTNHTGFIRAARLALLTLPMGAEFRRAHLESLVRRQSPGQVITLAGLKGALAKLQQTGEVGAQGCRKYMTYTVVQIEREAGDPVPPGGAEPVAAAGSAREQAWREFRATLLV